MQYSTQYRNYWWYCLSIARKGVISYYEYILARLPINIVIRNIPIVVGILDELVQKSNQAEIQYRKTNH